MSCTPSTVTAEMVAEAEKAYHDLVLGKAVVELTDQNGEKVRFAQAKRGDLYLYIQQLRSQYVSGCMTPTPSGPARFIF